MDARKNIGIDQNVNWPDISPLQLIGLSMIELAGANVLTRMVIAAVQLHCGNVTKTNALTRRQ